MLDEKITDIQTLSVEKISNRLALCDAPNRKPNRYAQFDNSPSCRIPSRSVSAKPLSTCLDEKSNSKIEVQLDNFEDYKNDYNLFKSFQHA